MALSSFSRSGLSRVVDRAVLPANFSNTATGTYSSGGVDYKYLTFTANGTLTVTSAGFLDMALVGGGRAGDGVTNEQSAGGAGGGLREVSNYYVTAGSYTITVGSGGTGVSGSSGGAGGISKFANVVVASGGGAGGGDVQGGAGGAKGGGTGGAGTSSSITGSATTYGGGGGGGGSGAGGAGGGGAAAGLNVDNGSAGTANTGGGGGGRWSTGSTAGYNGGSGIVIVRVRTN
jgi:hypothetical protein